MKANGSTEYAGPNKDEDEDELQESKNRKQMKLDENTN